MCNLKACFGWKQRQNGNLPPYLVCYFSLYNTKPFNCSWWLSSACILLLHCKGCSLKYQYFMTPSSVCDNCQAPISLPVLIASYLLATASRTWFSLRTPENFPVISVKYKIPHIFIPCLWGYLNYMSFAGSIWLAWALEERMPVFRGCRDCQDPFLRAGAGEAMSLLAAVSSHMISGEDSTHHPGLWWYHNQ